MTPEERRIHLKLSDRLLEVWMNPGTDQIKKMAQELYMDSWEIPYPELEEKTQAYLLLCQL